nr:hypothetical protein [Tanacetum cinerariifolium]
NIATALVCLATNRTYNFSKMIFDGMVKNFHNKGEGSGTPTEPHHTPFPEVESSHPTTSSILLPSIPTAPIPTAQEEEIVRLKERVQVLEDRKGVATKQSRVDAPIKGRSNNEGETTAERISNDSEEIARVLTSMDAATVARELEEQQEKEDMRMNEQIARDAEVARIHAEEEIQGMIDSLDKANESIAKYLQEYQEFASKLPLEKKIELISDLRRSNNEGEAAAERISNDSEEIANVLTSMDAATVLAGEIDVPTGSSFIPT